jgi:hypothetical protein
MTRTFAPGLFFVFATACGVSVQDLGHDLPGAQGADAPKPPQSRGGGYTGVLGQGAAPATTWEWLNPAPQGNRLRGAFGSAADDAWLVGDGNTALHWDGEKWRDMRGQLRGLDLYAGWSSGPNDVWVAGDMGVYYTFTDYAPGLPLYPRHPSGTGAILHFDGTTWTPDPHIGTRWAHALWGAGSDCVFALLENGDVARFDGKGWTVTASPANAVLRDVWGTSASNVWAVGDAGTIAHFDGEAWTTIATDPNVRYYGVWGRSSDDAWAVFVDTTSYTNDLPLQHAIGFAHWDGAGWRVTQRETIASLWRVLYSPDDATPFRTGHAIWGMPDGRAVAVANDGAEVWSFDGTAWSRETADTGSSMRAVWGHGDLIAVGEGGGAYKLDPDAKGAARWTPIFSGFRRSLTSLGIAGPNDIWARSVSDDGSEADVVRWTTGGWSHVHVASAAAPDKDVNVDALTVVSPTEVWIGGRHAIADPFGQAYALDLMKWDGAAWSAMPAPPVDSGIGAIYAAKGGTPWVLAREGLFRWSGAEWAQLTLPGDAIPLTMATLGDKDTWIVANANVHKDPLYVTVFHFDGAVMKQIFTARGGQWGSTITAAAPDDVWITAGEEGIIGTPFTAYHWDGHHLYPRHELNPQTILPAGGGTAYFLRFEGAGTMWSPSDVRRVLGYWDGTRTTILGETSADVWSLAAAKDAIWITGGGGATLRYPLTPGVR